MLGPDRGFPGSDKVVFFCFSIAIGAPTVSLQCFVLYFDNVMTEVPSSRPRWPRQEVRVTIGAWSRLRDFVSRQKSKELCRNRVWPRLKGLVSRHNILFCDRAGQSQEFFVVIGLATPGVSCRDKMFLYRDRVWQNEVVLCCDRAILCRDIVDQSRKILCRDRVGQVKGKLCHYRASYVTIQLARI